MNRFKARKNFLCQGGLSLAPSETNDSAFPVYFIAQVEQVMKKFIALFVGAMLLSNAAFAEVKIKGKNDQSVQVKGAVLNAAIGPGAKASQNISSNKGNVVLGGANKQSTQITGAVLNAAIGPGSKAEQNLASNDGK